MSDAEMFLDKCVTYKITPGVVSAGQLSGYLCGEALCLFLNTGVKMTTIKLKQALRIPRSYDCGDPKPTQFRRPLNLTWRFVSKLTAFLLMGPLKLCC